MPAIMTSEQRVYFGTLLGEKFSEACTEERAVAVADAAGYRHRIWFGRRRRLARARGELALAYLAVVQRAVRHSWPKVDAGPILEAMEGRAQSEVLDAVEAADPGLRRIRDARISAYLQGGARIPQDIACTLVSCLRKGALMQHVTSVRKLIEPFVGQIESMMDGWGGIPTRGPWVDPMSDVPQLDFTPTGHVELDGEMAVMIQLQNTLMTWPDSVRPEAMELTAAAMDGLAWSEVERRLESIPTSHRHELRTYLMRVT